MSDDSTPDQYATGITSDGERWSVARFGALLVTSVEGDADDKQWPDELTASREFADRAATLTPRAAS
jgi:hypothetical protein